MILLFLILAEFRLFFNIFYQDRSKRVWIVVSSGEVLRFLKDRSKQVWIVVSSGEVLRFLKDRSKWMQIFVSLSEGVYLYAEIKKRKRKKDFQFGSLFSVCAIFSGLPYLRFDFAGFNRFEVFLDLLGGCISQQGHRHNTDG